MKHTNFFTKSISTCFCLTFLLAGFNSFAQPGNALLFDGGNDQVYIGDYPQLNPGTITLQAWVNMEYVGGWPWRCVVTKRNCCGESVEEWTLQTEVGYKMSFHASTDVSSPFVTDPASMVAGEWIHFTATYDGHTANLYKNGNLVAQDTAAEGNIIPLSQPVIIGSRANGEGQDWFPGRIDEVRIWDYALTQEEILSTMNCELAGNEHGLIAYYNFNQGVPGGNNPGETTLTDHGPNHFDGTLQNFALSGPSSNWVASDFPAFSASISASGSTTVCKPLTVTLTASPASNGLTYQWKKGNTNITNATNSTYTADTKGTYKCVVANACGSATSNSIAVTVKAQPKATITPSGTVNMCAGNTTLLSANGGNNLSYQWKKGSANISGAINQTYNATTKGQYKVIVTNTSTGCSKTSAATKITITCKQDELQIVNTESRLSVFPNPSNGKFSIEFSSDKVGNTPATIQLISVTGQMVFEENMQMTDGKLQQEISLSSTLPGGIYVLQVKVNDEVYREKVVLQK